MRQTLTQEVYCATGINPTEAFAIAVGRLCSRALGVAEASRFAKGKARQKRLLSEILERDLDAIVVHLLVLRLGLLAALCAAMEKSRYVRDWYAALPIERVDLRR
jgi:hypothetical protein